MNVTRHHMSYAFCFFVPEKYVAAIRPRNNKFTLASIEIDSFNYKIRELYLTFPHYLFFNKILTKKKLLIV